MNEPANAGRLHRGHQGARALGVDRLERLRTALGDDRHEVNDRVDALDGPADGVAIRDRAGDGVDPLRRRAGTASKQTDVVSLGSQPRDEMASDEAGTACDQDLHPDRSLLGRTGLRVRK